MADDYIPHDDPRREENLNKFLSRSQVRNGAGDHVVLYHITPKDFGTFKAGGENPKLSGLATWLTPHKDQVSAWHNVGGDNGNFKPGTNVMPVHANITSPLILDTPEMLDWARHVYANKSIDFPHYISPETKAQLVEDGYDGIFFAGFHAKRHGTVPYENIGIGEQPHKDEEIIALHPEKQLKSATGNQGTFDPSEPDITKARGGSTFSAVDTDHPAFRSWFGKSVLHDDGVPRTYYHGTSKDIDFKKFKMSRHGIWMTSEPEYASQYALDNDSKGYRRDGWDVKPTNTASRVIPVHARIEKPFVGPMPEEYKQDNYKKSQSDWFDALRANGYDGWVPKSQDGKLAVALGHPGQIKSALSNSGEYSETGDINKADGGSVDNQQQRELNPLGFYSHAAEMASQLPQERGSPQQMAGMLTNKYGVKPVEMEGFDEAFAGQPSVTRDQLVQHFTSNMPQIERKVLGSNTKGSAADIEAEIANLQSVREQRQWTGEEEDEFIRLVGARNAGNDTKFQKYTLPGGENYREVLLKTPDQSGALRKEMAEAKSLRTQAVDDYANAAPGSPEAVEAQERIKKYTKIHTDLISKNTNLPPEFRSSHWDDPNVLAHIRMADRTGPNNEKILHVEEIQSDWGQKGKKEGFKSATSQSDYDNAVAALETKRAELSRQWPPVESIDDINRQLEPLQEAVSQASRANTTSVPPAPYVTNTAAWTDLALKDILREAAEGGYDKVVWTPGVEQAKRYDLSTHVDRIAYDPEEKTLSYVTKGSDGRGWTDHPGDVESKDLPNIIGKEAAEKLLAQKPNPLNGIHSLEAPDLVFGGEGMKGYYDKIVPTQLSKLLKKLDPEARIEAHNLDTRSPADKKMGLPEGQSINTVRAQSIRITPKMRESIKRGLPTYAEGGAVDDEDEGLTAYHGSPYDFEQFDTSKIGTGEGAQAYGHGLYFAESEPVAKEYRDRLTDKTTNFRVGDIDMPKWVLRSIETAEDKNAAIEKHRRDFSGRLAEAETERETSNQPWMVSGRISTAKDILAGLDQLQQGTPAPHTKGRMYEIKINAHPDHFLDWDAPVYEQPQFIQDAVKKSLDYAKENAANGPSALSGMFVNSERSAIQAHSDTYLEHDGAVIQNMLERVLGAQGTSDALAQHGVKGIKYFDGSSRDKGEGSRNYVVFNHDHVQVKRKYAQGGAIAGA